MDVSSWIIPAIMAGVCLCALRKKTDLYGALADGAADGLRIVLRIFPALVALLTAVAMCRASGALEWLTGLLSPVLSAIGIPPETAPLMLVRPVSGSAALGVGSELMDAYGVDSVIGRTAAVMLGSTETTFYTITVYFGAAGIHKTRHTIPAALIADMTGFLAASWCVRLLFGA